MGRDLVEEAKKAAEAEAKAAAAAGGDQDVPRDDERDPIAAAAVGSETHFRGSNPLLLPENQEKKKQPQRQRHPKKRPKKHSKPQQLYKPNLSDALRDRTGLFPASRPFLTGCKEITEESLIRWMVGDMMPAAAGAGADDGDGRADAPSFERMRRDTAAAAAAVNDGDGGDNDDNENDESERAGLHEEEEEGEDPYGRAYDARRKEMRRLAASIESGGARIDVDGRLVPVIPAAAAGAEGAAVNGLDERQRQQQHQPRQRAMLPPQNLAQRRRRDAMGNMAANVAMGHGGAGLLLGGNNNDNILPPPPGNNDDDNGGPPPPPEQQAQPQPPGAGGAAQGGGVGAGAVGAAQQQQQQRAAATAQREEREAAESIRRALDRYRTPVAGAGVVGSMSGAGDGPSMQQRRRLRNRPKQQAVPEGDIEYIPVVARAADRTNGADAAGTAANGGANDGDAARPPSLTFRRICFAVLAVVTAFVCIMLQTLPILEGGRVVDHAFDAMLHEIIVVRDFGTHLAECGNMLDRPEDDCSSSYAGGERILTTSGRREAVGGDDGSGRGNRMHLVASNFLSWLARAEVLYYPSWLSSSPSKAAAASGNSSSLGLHCPDCADGVLHIPSVSVLSDRYRVAAYASSEGGHDRSAEAAAIAAAAAKAELYRPFKDGVDVSWSVPCSASDDAGGTSDALSSCLALPRPRPSIGWSFFGSGVDDAGTSQPSSCQSKDRTGRRSNGGVCESNNDDRDGAPPTKNRCFRGVHDGIISSKEVDAALRMAADLIRRGGDHVQIHRDVSELEIFVPSILDKVENLFRTRYGIASSAVMLKPVAFRVSVALPMVGASFQRYSKRTGLLIGAVNRTTYYEWEEANHRRNSRAGTPFSFPRRRKLFFSSAKPFRDPCVLMSDTDAYPDFALHSSIFLSDGAGEDFSGGTALYVDDHRSNSNPRKRIRRGVVVDGTRGRVVLSTGGRENRRCRMPTRLGIRAVLQIWWGCV